MNVFDLIREKLKKEKEDKQAAYEYAVDRNLFGMADVLMGKVAEIDDVMKIIDEAEKEYNNGWIPCTTELPPQPKSNPEFEGKPLELYLVSRNDYKYPWRAFWNGEDFTDGFRKVYPVAWQPLPEQYKGEQE